MRFLIRGSAHMQLRALVHSHKACIGLFAAAEALQLGHVKGVPPYVYVRKLPRFSRDAWSELVPVSPAEPPDLILRQALAPESVFRGAVDVEEAFGADLIEITVAVGKFEHKRFPEPE